MSEANLITSYVFQDKEFLIKMNVVKSFLEISVTDKQSGEEWQCSYDQPYIENLTHKTGNYKQFKIFTTMLKSGLLRTSESITLDLLTYEDLEALRMKRIRSHNSRTLINKEKNNRRYLILIYNVEFDRILYPLPLEYCGPPDPTILQSTIRKLESELGKAREELETRYLRNDTRQLDLMQKRIDDLIAENISLINEVKVLRMNSGAYSKSKQQALGLQNVVNQLERSVVIERRSHQKAVEKLRHEKALLVQEVERARKNERMLQAKLSQECYKSPNRGKGDFNRIARRDYSLKTVYRGTSPNNVPRVGIKPQSLTNSPRISRSENFIKTQRKPAVRTIKKKNLKSRCSSASSSKNSDQEIEYNNDINVARSTSKERASRRPSSLERSCSAISVATAHSQNPPSTHLLKMRMKSSEEEFRALENRINSLQRMLQEDVQF